MPLRPDCRSKMARPTVSVEISYLQPSQIHLEIIELPDYQITQSPNHPITQSPIDPLTR